MDIGIPSGILQRRVRPLPARTPGIVGAALMLALGGCRGGYESLTRSDLAIAADGFDADPEASTPELDGRLSSYLAFALGESPDIRAAFERWRAATLEVAETRRLPEPVIKYSYYVRSVETRVGPQEHKLSLAQWFPWPTKLTAGADAQATEARAWQRRFDAEVLAVRQSVATGYWRLWLIHEEHRLKNEHDLVLETLSGTVRGRVSTGAASLADLNQVELGIAVHHDHHGEHREQERAARAELLRAIGADASTAPLETTDSPVEGLPAEPADALHQAARDNPSVEAAALMAESAEDQARADAAKRAPDLHVGLEWIVTGDSQVPIPDSGQDAVIVSAGFTVPLWGRSYRDGIGAARADAAAYRAEQDAALLQADALVEASIADVHDAQRRIELCRDTLIPQAETTFRSVLGSYQTGRSEVAAALLAQRQLLELQLELARSRARHAVAWARLERIVGRPVALIGNGGSR